MTEAKILIVDNDPAVGNLMERFLIKMNYQVEVAENGKTARALFEQFQPNLVILNASLPDVTGFNLCQELKNHNDVLALIMNPRSEEQKEIKEFIDCADGYLTKPFGLGELGLKVARILNGTDINTLKDDYWDYEYIGDFKNK